MTLKLPWDRKRNVHKKAGHYRALCESPRPSQRYDALKLEEGASLAMPHASWINIQKVWVIPLELLRPFSANGWPCCLPQLQADSLIDLKYHMSADCRRWREHIQKLRAAEPIKPDPTPLFSPSVHAQGDSTLAGEAAVARSWAAVLLAAPTSPPRMKELEEEEEDIKSTNSDDRSSSAGSIPSLSASSYISTASSQSMGDSNSGESTYVSDELTIPVPLINSPQPDEDSGNTRPTPSWAATLVAPAPLITQQESSTGWVRLKKSRPTAVLSFATRF